MQSESYDSYNWRKNFGAQSISVQTHRSYNIFSKSHSQMVDYDENWRSNHNTNAIKDKSQDYTIALTMEDALLFFLVKCGENILNIYKKYTIFKLNKKLTEYITYSNDTSYDKNIESLKIFTDNLLNFMHSNHLISNEIKENCFNEIITGTYIARSFIVAISALKNLNLHINSDNSKLIHETLNLLQCFNVDLIVCFSSKYHNTTLSYEMQKHIILPILSQLKESLNLFNDDCNFEIDNMSFNPTYLHFAAERGMHLVVQWLLKEGFDVNKKDDYGFTAIAYAINKNHINVIETLITAGANLDEPCFKNNPFEISNSDEKLSIIESLLQLPNPEVTIKLSYILYKLKQHGIDILENPKIYEILYPKKAYDQYIELKKIDTNTDNLLDTYNINIKLLEDFSNFIVKLLLENNSVDCSKYNSDQQGLQGVVNNYELIDSFLEYV